MGTRFVSCFIQTKTNTKMITKTNIKGEKKYEHKNKHTRSIEISMVKEGDIVVSIWDLARQDEYHAIK